MPKIIKVKRLILFILLIGSVSEAKLFRNSYVQFELPDQWNCKLEGTEYTCSSLNPVDSKESIIVLAAKEMGPQDTLVEYERFLKTPKDSKLLSGKGVKSEVKFVKPRQILGHPWVDGMHLGSEIPGYYTRYAATVKGTLAILVTFSAHQKFYTKYAKDFIRAIETLRLVSGSGISTSGMGKIGPGGMPGGSANTFGSSEPMAMGPSVEDIPTPKDAGTRKTPLLIIAGAFLIAAAFLILKK